MPRQLTTRSRFLVGALALTLAVAPSATCLAAVSQIPDTHRQACCAAMEGDCGSATTLQHDCCAAQNPQFAGLAPAPATRLLAPPAALISLLLTLESSGLPTRRSPIDADVSVPSSAPIYLLASVFRI